VRRAADAQAGHAFDGVALLEYDEYSQCTYSKEAPMATSVRLDPDLEQRLDRLAGLTGRTKAYYLREMIQNGLEDLEDYYLASATMENVRRGKEKVHTAKDVRRRLGLDN
jgi:RHH-type rel operon transcriptional repressor/antitoxin RelB